MSWFKDLYPDVPRDFPPDFVFKENKKYRITFLEDTPRKVMGGFRRPTMVSVIEYDGEKMSLYVGSHVDLARQISNIELNRGNLKNLVVDITKKSKRGRKYIFKIEIISE